MASLGFRIGHDKRQIAQIIWCPDKIKCNFEEYFFILLLAFDFVYAKRLQVLSFSHELGKVPLLDLDRRQFVDVDEFEDLETLVVWNHAADLVDQLTVYFRRAYLERIIGIIANLHFSNFSVRFELLLFEEIWEIFTTPFEESSIFDVVHLHTV